MSKRVALLLCGLWIAVSSFGAAHAAGATGAENLDARLGRIIAARGLEPLETPPFVVSRKYRLGQMLFFDPILSGNRDVSCATCHLHGRGTSDAVALSIGVGGAGLAENRRFVGRFDEHPRNTIDIWNRSHESVINMFWDGRVRRIEATGRILSPLGDSLPDGIDNVLAAQALFPLTGPEEMLGEPGDRSARDLPDGHAGQPNDFAEAARDLDGPEKLVAIHDAVMKRLLGRAGTPLADWQVAYRHLIAATLPDKPLGAVTIGDLANAIGHFQAVAFATRDTPWDRYLAGDTGAIADEAKRGALLFYGKARCAVCHSGPLFSDFQFHSLGVEQIGPGFNDSGDDRGRYHATRIPKHLYQFRTPPLRNVTLTAPYFHDGVMETLDGAIAWHLSPPRAGGDDAAREVSSRAVMRARSVSPILARGIALSAAERASLIAFLASLEDGQAHRRSQIVPDHVPSGLPVSAIAPGG